MVLCLIFVSEIIILFFPFVILCCAHLLSFLIPFSISDFVPKIAFETEYVLRAQLPNEP